MESDFTYELNTAVIMLHRYILIFTLLISCQGDLARDIEPKIVNGRKAKLGDFPHQVLIQKHGKIHCGGSILDNNYILTAAHCVVGHSAKSFDVLVGSVNVKSLTYPASNHTVAAIYAHEKYKPKNGFKNDIAVLKLGKSIAFNEYVAPATLPKSYQDLKNGQAAVVTGFGRTSNLAALSTILYKTDVFVISRTDCQKSYKMDKIRTTNLCTRHPTSITGFCRGDSGGPLTVNGQVVGVVSFALDNACASKSKKPQVYTRVSEYIDWIKSHIE